VYAILKPAFHAFNGFPPNQLLLLPPAHLFLSHSRQWVRINLY